MEEIIKVKIPKGFMNCSVSKNNVFIADTNDSSNWDTIKFPLPEPRNKWNIQSVNDCVVTLIDNI